MVINSSPDAHPSSLTTTFEKRDTWTVICKEAGPLAGGFCFGEGPRWHDGALWFSDMLGAAVHTVDLTGHMTTIPLPGRAPSGLGFAPDGALLIVSTEDRQVLRYADGEVSTLADLAALVPANLGDMVVEAANGLPVMIDSGIRRGTDVVKALGLGADFVFLGRPFNYAAAVGGQEGVAYAIDILKAEVTRTLAQIGVIRPDSIDPGQIVPRGVIADRSFGKGTPQ